MVAAKNRKEARAAATDWQKQYQLDDVTGESLLNGDKFSNFAVELATMYKGESQKFIQSTFDNIYDIVQGTKESTLFEEADNTPRSLVEAIKETLNFEYDGLQGNRTLAGNHATGQAGQQGSTGDAATGERVESGERTADRGRGTDADCGESRTEEVNAVAETNTNPAEVQKGVAANDKQRGAKNEKPTLSNVIAVLYEKGKEYASNLFGMKFFDVAETPQFMKDLGITGSKFTNRYEVISRHFGKDGSHDFRIEEWQQLSDAIKNPFAITIYKDKNKGYRIYTALKTRNEEYIVVGVDVKNAGRDLEINAISTIFGRRTNANLPENEEVIYVSETITPEQQSLLGRPNSDQYPAERESS